ncbi:MAG TPA: TonB-dependent receptor [Sphingopyxis sp.]|uniref:TonB-dependent receptor domain-containing protein n=1 Tax=Sphingopyxis sp. TaxID=1908224 RepID=UPI002C48F042|nr:TonB-dependent receptor [Sphingopyxis sp.]HWW57048.1 TonB-dependent receptor [Sphingopyxis sp.]
MYFQSPWLVGRAMMAAVAVAAFPVHAQTVDTTDERAVERAADAFGVRIGVEQIGLYTETQVRGFNLQDAGNYRINDSYFAKSGGVIDTILSGVVTRVGYNALDTDFATPSGVVEYRLRSPFDASPVHVEVMLRDYGGHSYDLRLAQTSADNRLAGLVGAQALLGKSSSGLSPKYYRFGAVTEWRPVDGTSVTGFASLNIFDLEGFYGVSVSGAKLPRKMKHPRRYVTSWSDHDGADLNIGVLGSARLDDAFDVTGSLIYSRLDLDRADFTQLVVDEDGLGRATGFANRPRNNETWSASLGGSWRLAADHRLYAELRGRQTRNRFAPGVSVELGAFDLGEGIAPSPEPDLPPLPTTLDSIDQISGAFGYEATMGRLRLKGGIQKSWHRREIAAPARPRESTTQKPWLYDASIAFAIAPDWTVFASATRGLEESGAAPDNAANRNDVLPPALSTQRELGFHGRLTDGLTLIGSLFSIEKAAPGFDANNVYGLFGELRHRGVELSMVGNVTPRLRIVSGAVYLDARRSGEPVQTGAWSKEAVGLPKFQAMTGLTYAVPAVEGLSFDGQVNHSSSRRASSRSELRTPSLTTVDIGLRQGFDIGKTKMAIRARMTNLFGADSWVAARSELLDRPSRRAFRLSLTVNI